MSSPIPPRIAIVGSGPSGCYLAQSLRRAWPDAEITIFDRLVSPYGLVRYGVAADHQNTKNIFRQFVRLFERDGVRFAGNVDVGTDVTLAELQQAFSVVVLATGLAIDRSLDVPGASLGGVYGAGVLTRVLNSDPLIASDFPALGERIVLIGGGNVAVDIMRFLIKAPEHFELSDVSDDALAAYARAPAQRVEVVSRSPVERAKSDPVMIRELGKVSGVRFVCDDSLEVPADADKAAQQRAQAVRELVALPPDQPVRVELVFRFGWTPQRIDGRHRVEAVELLGPGGEITRVPADSVISAIGFELGGALKGVLDEAIDLDPTDESGRLAEGLYRTGWLRRGPRGTIPENRSCAQSVAAEIVADVDAGVVAVHHDQQGFAGLPARTRERVVDYEAWTRLDAVEIASAAPGRVRRKTPDHAAMLAVARDGTEETT